MRFDRQRDGLQFLPGMRFDRAPSGEADTFHGVASAYNVPTLNDMIFRPGAFRQSIVDRPTMPLLWAHDMDKPIGRITKTREDDKGLHVEFRINRNVAQGAEALALVDARDLDSMSIGYLIHKDTKEKWFRVLRGHEDGPAEVFKADVLEVSLVSIPANPGAKIVSADSLASEPRIHDKLDLREFQRGMGFSRKITEAAADLVWPLVEKHVGDCSSPLSCSLCERAAKRDEKMIGENGVVICFDCAAELGRFVERRGVDMIDLDRVAKHVKFLGDKLARSLKH